MGINLLTDYNICYNDSYKHFIYDAIIGIVLVSNTYNTSAIYKICLLNKTRLNSVYRWGLQVNI